MDANEPPYAANTSIRGLLIPLDAGFEDKLLAASGFSLPRIPPFQCMIDHHELRMAIQQRRLRINDSIGIAHTEYVDR